MILPGKHLAETSISVSVDDNLEESSLEIVGKGGAGRLMIVRAELKDKTVSIRQFLSYHHFSKIKESIAVSVRTCTNELPPNLACVPMRNAIFSCTFKNLLLDVDKSP